MTSHSPVVGRRLRVVSPLILRGRVWGLAPKISAQEHDRTGARRNVRRNRVREMSKRMELDQENRERRQTNGNGEMVLGEKGKSIHSWEQRRLSGVNPGRWRMGKKGGSLGALHQNYGQSVEPVEQLAGLDLVSQRFPLSGK